MPKFLLALNTAALSKHGFSAHRQCLLGGTDSFVSLLILSEHGKDSFFLPLRGAVMIGIHVFHTVHPFLVDCMELL